MRASWNIGDCFVSGGRAHAVVQVVSDSARTFKISVQLGSEVNPVAGGTVTVATQPGQLAQGVFTANVPGVADGHVPCRVTSIVDESNQPPLQGDPLPPPPDTMPNATATGPPPTAPPPSVPSTTGAPQPS